jgi:hypothetical protein
VHPATQPADGEYLARADTHRYVGRHGLAVQARVRLAATDRDDQLVLELELRPHKGRFEGGGAGWVPDEQVGSLEARYIDRPGRRHPEMRAQPGRPRSWIVVSGPARRTTTCVTAPARP